MSDTTYEGWKNYETWNVALWVNNEYPLYLSATLFMKAYSGAMPYRDWVKIAGLGDKKTPDGCNYISKRLSYSELNEMMRCLNA